MHLVSEDIEKYCLAKSTRPSKYCEAIHEYTKANVPMSQMVVGPIVGSFLGFMVRLSRAKRILEIGTYTGYSALVMAEQLPVDGELITMDVNEETTGIAQSFWKKSPDGKKIKSVLGPALENLEKIKGPFDLVLIDADKENYLHYLKRALTLLSPQGIIVLDNCLWNGRVLENPPPEGSTKALQDVNDYIASNKKLIGCLSPIRDGLFLVQKAD